MQILYCDEALVLVNKPTMLLSVPGRGEDKQDCVVSRLAADLGWVREVHRLDWETSGLMLLARDAESHRHLSGQFARREVEKIYIAVLLGALSETQGEINLPLRCDWPRRPRQMVDHEQGKAACTRWELLAQEARGSRVRLYPLTGRSHQLRVHMQSIGHPILGDRLYAPAESLALADRLLLHACHLAFTHPVTGELMRFDCDAGF